MDRETASLWMDLMVVLYSMVGITSSERYGATWYKNRDWSFFFMFLTPECLNCVPRVSKLWGRLLGWKPLARYCEHRRLVRWSSTGEVIVDWRGDLRQESFWYPRINDQVKSTLRSRWLRGEHIYSFGCSPRGRRADTLDWLGRQPCWKPCWSQYYITYYVIIWLLYIKNK